MGSVEVRKIRKAYGATTVIHELDLAIRSGEFLVLVGPSGCGKSTLLRMIAGLEDVTSGEVRIDDRVVNDLSPKERGIAMVFQSYALYPHMSVRENLAFSLKLSRLPRTEIEKRVSEAASVLGIESHLDKKPGQLSGGQKQRVAMGRAMVRHPKVFLFDEPLSNLDAQMRVKMRAEISLLHRRLGSTIVYVTHDQVEAMTLATRIAVLHQGHIEQLGTPLELYANPATQFVASFIGTPSMNFSAVARAGRAAPAGASIVGFRPEHVVLSRDGAASGLLELGRGKVILVEPLGNLTHVHIETGGETFVIEVPAEKAPSLETECGLAIAPEKLFFFDAAGKRVRA